MDNLIQISKLSDFIFCPRSLYFHEIYESFETSLFQDTPQINGKAKHASIDSQTYSDRKDILISKEVFSEKYQLIGKIDIFYISKGLLVERKAKIKKIFDGYIFQLYAQKLCLEEAGYNVQKMQIRSLEDNKVYNITESQAMWTKFFDLLTQIREFDFKKSSVYQNANKCDNCVYKPLCH